MSERIWLASYPEGVPADIDPSSYPSLVALMDEAFLKYADRTAYRFMGQSVSYADTDAQIRAPMCPLGVGFASAWPPQHKLKAAMAERDGRCSRAGEARNSAAPIRRSVRPASAAC